MASNYSIAYSFVVNNAQFIQGIQQVKKELKTFKDTMKSYSYEFSQEMKQAGQSFINLGKTMSGVSIPTAAFTGFSLKAFAELELVENKVKKLFKEDIKGAMEFAREYSDRAGYSFKETVNTLGMLKAQQKRVGLTDAGVFASTEAVGNVIMAYTSMESQRKDAFQAIQSTLSKGKLTQAGLSNFYAAGIDIMDILAKHSGKTIEHVQAVYEAGGVSATAVLKAILKESELPEISELIEENKSSLDARWGDVKNNFTAFRAEIGRLISETLNLPEIFKTISDTLKKWAFAIKDIDPFFKKLIAFSLVGVSLATPILLFAGALMKLGKFLVMIKMFTTAFGLLNLVMLANPAVLITTAIVGLVTMLFGYENVIKAIGGTIKTVFGWIMEGVQKITEFLSKAMDFVMPFLNKTKDVFQKGLLGGKMEQNIGISQEYKKGVELVEQREAKTDLTVIVNNEAIFEKDTLKSSKTKIDNPNAAVFNAMSKSYYNVSFARE